MELFPPRNITVMGKLSGTPKVHVSQMLVSEESYIKDIRKNTVKIDPLPLSALGHTPSSLHADVLYG